MKKILFVLLLSFIPILGFTEDIGAEQAYLKNDIESRIIRELLSSPDYDDIERGVVLLLEGVTNGRIPQNIEPELLTNTFIKLDKFELGKDGNYEKNILIYKFYTTIKYFRKEEFDSLLLDYSYLPGYTSNNNVWQYTLYREAFSNPSILSGKKLDYITSPSVMAVGDYEPLYYKYFIDHIDPFLAYAKTGNEKARIKESLKNSVVYGKLDVARRTKAMNLLITIK